VIKKEVTALTNSFIDVGFVFIPIGFGGVLVFIDIICFYLCILVSHTQFTSGHIVVGFTTTCVISAYHH